MKRLSSSIAGAFLVSALALTASTSFAQSESTSKSPKQSATELNIIIPAVRPNDGFLLTRPNDLGHLGIAVNGILGFGYRPQTIKVLPEGKTDRKDAKDWKKDWKLVEYQLIGNLGLSFGLWDRISIDALVPVQLYTAGQSYEDFRDDEKRDDEKKGDSKITFPPRGQNNFADTDSKQMGLGDTRLGVRGRIYGENDSFLSVGAYAGVILPTSQWVAPFKGEKCGGDKPCRSQKYWGVDAYRANLNALLEIRPLDRLNIDVNLGGTFEFTNEAQSLFSKQLDQQVTLGAGASYAFLEQKELTVHLESIAKIRGFENFFKVGDNTKPGFEDYQHLIAGQVMGGVKYRTSYGLSTGLAVGVGVGNGWGTPLASALFNIGWSSESDPDTDGDGINDSVDKCPEVPEDFDKFEDDDGCPELDNDNDGINDDLDQCPNDPEDIDGFEDTDGCPDPDNDQDGILDVDDLCPDEAGIPERQGCPVRDADGDGIEDEVDKCPSDPEDKDGFEDTDGCPDTDNDSDGIPDANDKCPNEDGPASNQGCPIKDQDKDGIPDDVDKCPDKPETYNGIKDDDGCPDGKATVVVTETEIKINQTVYFASGKSEIKKKSFKLLDTVANVLNTYDLITKLLVAGHTDDVGKDEDNLQLSKDRAKAVREYLVSKGVDPNRLESEGYGETRPLCTDLPELTKTKRDARKNRRKIKDCRSDNRRVEFRVVEINNKPIQASEEVKIKVEQRLEE